MEAAAVFIFSAGKFFLPFSFRRKHQRPTGTCHQQSKKKRWATISSISQK
jgi:hypothetical protein